MYVFFLALLLVLFYFLFPPKKDTGITTVCESKLSGKTGYGVPHGNEPKGRGLHPSIRQPKTVATRFAWLQHGTCGHSSYHTTPPNPNTRHGCQGSMRVIVSDRGVGPPKNGTPHCGEEEKIFAFKMNTLFMINIFISRSTPVLVCT